MITWPCSTTSTSWWSHWEPKTAAHLSDYWKASRNCLSKYPHLHHAPQRSCQCYIRATQALRKSEMRARVGWWGGAGVLSEWEFGISKARLFPLQQLPGHLLPLWRSVASDHRYFFIFPSPTNARKRCIFKPVLGSSSRNMKGLRRRSPQDNCVNSLRNPEDVRCLHLIQLLTYNKYSASLFLVWKVGAVI